MNQVLVFNAPQHRNKLKDQTGQNPVKAPELVNDPQGMVKALHYIQQEALRHGFDFPAHLIDVAAQAFSEEIIRRGDVLPQSLSSEA